MPFSLKLLTDHGTKKTSQMLFFKCTWWLKSDVLLGENDRWEVGSFSGGWRRVPGDERAGQVRGLRPQREPVRRIRQWLLDPQALLHPADSLPHGKEGARHLLRSPGKFHSDSSLDITRILEFYALNQSKICRCCAGPWGVKLGSRSQDGTSASGKWGSWGTACSMTWLKQKKQCKHRSRSL